MKKEEFIKLIQKRIAESAIGASTARRMGGPGTVKAARDFLTQLDLKKISTARNEYFFTKWLNKTVEKLIESLPDESQYFGSARKFLNIFLRDALYNRYLCKHYNLDRLADWFELPLDSQTAKGLRKESDGKIKLPRWKSVISLTENESNRYQDFAKQVGFSKKIKRVHLDLLYWRGT